MRSDMWWGMIFLVLWSRAVALRCYNCSSSHRDWGHCGGDFVATIIPFNTSQEYLVNCSTDHALCFVRSWSARAHHSWVVQRGCYVPRAKDELPRALHTTLRSMSCNTQRYTNGEYKLCFCNTDWCNSAALVRPGLLCLTALCICLGGISRCALLTKLLL